MLSFARIRTQQRSNRSVSLGGLNLFFYFAVIILVILRCIIYLVNSHYNLYFASRHGLH